MLSHVMEMMFIGLLVIHELFIVALASGGIFIIHYFISSKSPSPANQDKSFDVSIS